MQDKEHILKLIDSYWKFDNNQQPMSSWHDKQDLLNEIDKYLSENKVKCTNDFHNLELAMDCKCGRCGLNQ